MDSKILLAIETSSNICSVAIIKRYKILSVIENNAQKQHVEIIPSYVEQAMDQSKISIDNLDAIALSIGPGSFTGLRIGLGFSKGMNLGIKLSKCLLISINKKSENVIYFRLLRHRR